MKFCKLAIAAVIIVSTNANAAVITTNNVYEQFCDLETDIYGNLTGNEICYDSDIIEYTSIDTVYELMGTVDVYVRPSDPGVAPYLFIRNAITTGTYTHSVWEDYRTMQLGKTDVLNINPAFSPGGAVVAGQYLYEVSSSELVDSPDSESNHTLERMLSGDGSELSINNLTQWNKLISGDSVSFNTLDADGDGVAGVNTIIFEGLPVAIDYSLTAIPVPASIWLLGSGLISLAGIARRRKA